VLSLGGQVMKNVAGYDVSRLLAGSLGTLGLIAEVSLKIAPRPQTQTTLRLEAPQARALELMNRWAGQPLPVSATAWHDGELSCGVGLGGRARRGGEIGGATLRSPGQAFASTRVPPGRSRCGGSRSRHQRPSLKDGNWWNGTETAMVEID
jgi:glycolate oxidase FAD binding subunit